MKRILLMTAGLVLACTSAHAAIVNQTCQGFSYATLGHSSGVVASVGGTANCSVTRTAQFGDYQIIGYEQGAGVGSSATVTAYYDSQTILASNGFVLDIAAGGNATVTSFYTGTQPLVGAVSIQSFTINTFQVDQLYQYSLFAGDVANLSSNFFGNGATWDYTMPNSIFTGFLRPGETYSISGGALEMVGASNGTSSGGWGGQVALLAATAVPEPSTLALLGTGISLMRYVRRRKAA